MRSARHRGMITIGFAASLALAAAAGIGRDGRGGGGRDTTGVDETTRTRAAQSARGGRGGEARDTTGMDETTGSVGGKRASAGLALSDEQRGRIYEGVMRVSDAPGGHAD